MSRFVGIEPATQTIEVVAERSDLSLFALASFLFPLNQRRVLRSVTVMSRFVGIEPSAQTVEVIAERSNLAPLPSLQLSLPQRGVLARIPLGSLLVRVKPEAQAVQVIAERSDLSSLALPPFPLQSLTLPPFSFTLLPLALCALLLFSLKQHCVLRSVTVTPRFVSVEPKVQSINVITESRNLLALASRQLAPLPLLFPLDVGEALLLQQREFLRPLASQPCLVPFPPFALLPQICLRCRRSAAWPIRRQAADVLDGIRKPAALNHKRAKPRERSCFFGRAVSDPLGMVNLIPQLADHVHSPSIRLVEVRECVTVLLDQEGNVGEVDQVLRRRAPLERLLSPRVAVRIALAGVVVEHLRAKPVRPVFTLEGRRDVHAHRVSVDRERVVRPVPVRKAALSHDRPPSVSDFCGSPPSAAMVRSSPMETGHPRSKAHFTIPTRWLSMPMVPLSPVSNPHLRWRKEHFCEDEVRDGEEHQERCC